MSDTLRDALIDEIKDLYNAEKQLTKALPKMAKNATNEDLRAALESHLAETEGHVGRLEQVFEMLDEKVRGKQCAGMAGIIEEGNQMLQEDLEDAVLDACIIAAGQRAEHYEMAAYGTSIAWAEALGLNDVAELLRETLEEEKAADEKLSALAEGNINSEAAAGADSVDDESENSDNEEEDTPPASRQMAARGAGNGSAAKSAKRSAGRR
jgi:ferritin-like metal-binding protein YciE